MSDYVGTPTPEYELVWRQPWPAMTRGIWGDRERYLEACWSTFPGLWHHGDHALADR